ncbi:MAG: hypothetical protein WCD83_23765 [Pseudolabrys sp.]
MTKRSYGDGGIDQRSENTFRLVLAKSVMPKRFTAPVWKPRKGSMRYITLSIPASMSIQTT